ncbi:modification methylase [Candidatus Gracilibacteria bacterium]|nr:MAG: modification methylase [Candidatus Gracilibacteria bacterium]
MNYIGSKKSLLEFIEKSINSVVSEKNYTFSDLFAGTGIVGRYFKEKGHSVIVNDLQYYSFVLNRNYIGNYTDLYFTGLLSEIPELLVGDVNTYKKIVINYLNKLPNKKGFIYKNYSAGGTKGKEYERMYFSDENAMKCDAIRFKIEKWKKENKVTENEYYFLLASLIESIDKVANTASVYGAFLKKLKCSAKKTMILKPADFYLNNNKHIVYNSDINELIKHTSHDVVYLDPPYNARQYSGNYHILETIAKYDNPKIKGKTGMRNCEKQKSDYCKKAEVKKSFRELIQNIDAKYVFLSYNCEGLMSFDDIKKIMSERGKYGVFTKKYKRFKADKTEARNHKKDSVTEYLHYVVIK